MRHNQQRYVGGELVLVVDCSDLERETAFWCDALGYRRDGAALVPYQGLIPPDGKGLQLLLQRVNDRKPAKNRLPLDLRASTLGHVAGFQR
jgi:hypothetical protein